MIIRTLASAVWADLAQAAGLPKISPQAKGGVTRRLGLSHCASYDRDQALRIAADFADQRDQDWLSLARIAQVDRRRRYHRRLDEMALDRLAHSLSFWTGRKTSEIAVLVNTWSMVFGVRNPWRQPVCAQDTGNLVALAIDFALTSRHASKCAIRDEAWAAILSQAVAVDSMDVNRITNLRRQFLYAVRRHGLADGCLLAVYRAAHLKSLDSKRLPSPKTKRCASEVDAATQWLINANH